MKIHLPKLSFDAKLQRKLLVAIVILAVLGGVASLVPLLINQEALKNQVIDSFKAQTGYDLELDGDAVVKPFPTPHVVVNSLVVRNVPGANSPFLLSVKLVDLHLSMLRLLRGSFTIDSIKIKGVELELEHMKNGQFNWRDESVHSKVTAKSEPDENALITVPTIEMTDGIVRYIDDNYSSTTEYKHISLYLDNGAGTRPSTLTGSIQYGDKTMAAQVHFANLRDSFSGTPADMALSITSGKDRLHYEGTAALKEGVFLGTGKAQIGMENMVPWIGLVNGEPEITAADAAYAPLPIEIQTDIAADSEKMLLSHVALKGATASGNFDMSISPQHHIEMKGAFDTLALDTIFASKLFAPAPVISAAEKQKEENSFVQSQKSWFDLLDMHAELKLADIVYNQQHLTDSHIEFDLAGGEMTITQAASLMPGQTRFIFTGLGKKGYQGFALEGEVDAAGDNFTQMMNLFKSRGVTFPPEDFRRFRLKANMVLSAHDMRLSEIRTRVEDVGIVGGIIATFGARTRIEAALQLGGLNLDHFTTLWGLNSWRESFSSNDPGGDHPLMMSQWLRQLGYDMRLSIALEQYVLGGKHYDKASFKVRAATNRLIFNDVDMAYNGSQLAGNISIDVSEALPRIELSAAADKFDWDQFFDNVPKPNPAASPQAGHWSKDEFNFQWLELANVVYRLKCGTFRYGSTQIDNLNLRGNIDSRIMNIDAITGTVFDSRISGRIILTGEKIPRFNLALDIVSLAPEKIVSYMPTLQGMSGKYNLTARLNTSGINIFSWVSNLEGTLGIGGTNVTVQGFNLPGIIRAVSYVRTVADILNVVKRAFPGGSTTFNRIEGQWVIAAGVIKMPNVKLSNADTDGTMSGEIDLPDWKTQGRIAFTLKTLDRQHPPSMTINFSGGVDSPEKALDTRSLEQYVTNKTSEKMLQQYGAPQ
jgi:uncharacterized protein involved in outer membrane biogenesis